MSDELLDDTTNASADLDDSTEGVGDEEKEISDDIDPSDLPLDETEDLSEDVVANPEIAEDPFDLGAFGELNDDGEFEAPNLDEEDEEDDQEISEDLF